MKNKKKIIIFLSLAILFVLGVYLVNNQENTDNDVVDLPSTEKYNNPTKFANKEINWEDIVHVSFSGFEGNPSIQITYDEIPEFEERLLAERNGWENVKLELSESQDKEEIQKFLQFTSGFDASREWCSLPADYKNIKNGDEFELTCGNSTLEALNYSYNDTYKVIVDGIWKDETPVFEEQKETTSSEVIIKNNQEYEMFVGTMRVENEVQYWDLDSIMVISTEDLSKVNLNSIEADIVINVPVEMFDETLEYARKNGIEYIQVDDKVYTKESDYKEYMEWRGVASKEE